MEIDDCIRKCRNPFEKRGKHYDWGGGGEKTTVSVCRTPKLSFARCAFARGYYDSTWSAIQLRSLAAWFLVARPLWSNVNTAYAAKSKTSSLCQSELSAYSM